jgi:hypothetical protein
VDNTDVKKKQLDKLQRRDSELKMLIKRVFEQNAIGVLDDSVFHDLLAEYRSEQKNNEALISNIQTDLTKSDRTQIEMMRLFGVIQSFHCPLAELTREILVALIDRIDIHEPEGPRCTRNRPQKYDIKFKFIHTD